MVCILICVGEPVQCTAWLGQCILYILIVMFEKVLMMLLLLIPQWKKVKKIKMYLLFFPHLFLPVRVMFLQDNKLNFISL